VVSLLNGGRGRGTYDLIVDMIAIHQLPTYEVERIPQLE
jgi:hypothetical protein